MHATPELGVFSQTPQNRALQGILCAGTRLHAIYATLPVIYILSLLQIYNIIFIYKLIKRVCRRVNSVESGFEGVYPGVYQRVSGVYSSIFQIV